MNIRSVIIDEEENAPKGDDAIKAEVKKELISKLAAEWNSLHHEQEIRSWRDEREIDEEGDYLAERCIDQVHDRINELAASGKRFFSQDDWSDYTDQGRAIWKNGKPVGHFQSMSKQRRARFRRVFGALEKKFENEFYQKIREEDRKQLLRKQAVEELLHSLGARMARPYEHWNEEEHIMEYLERDRD